MEDFWEEAEMEIDQMSKGQKIAWLVVIAMMGIALLSMAGILVMQLVHEVSNLMKGKIISFL